MKNIFQKRAVGVVGLALLFTMANGCGIAKDPYNNSPYAFSQSSEGGITYVLYSKDDKPVAIERRLSKNDKRIDSKPVEHLTMAQAELLQEYYINGGALAWNDPNPAIYADKKSVVASNNL